MQILKANGMSKKQHAFERHGIFSKEGSFRSVSCQATKTAAINERAYHRPHRHYSIWNRPKIVPKLSSRLKTGNSVELQDRNHPKVNLGNSVPFRDRIHPKTVLKLYIRTKTGISLKSGKIDQFWSRSAVFGPKIVKFGRFRARLGSHHPLTGYKMPPDRKSPKITEKYEKSPPPDQPPKRGKHYRKDAQNKKNSRIANFCTFSLIFPFFRGWLRGGDFFGIFRGIFGLGQFYVLKGMRRCQVRWGFAPLSSPGMFFLSEGRCHI